MSNQGKTLEKLHRLETLCRQGYASDIVEVTYTTVKKQAIYFGFFSKQYL
jgi:hypothetical protein